MSSAIREHRECECDRLSWSRSTCAAKRNPSGGWPCCHLESGDRDHEATSHGPVGRQANPPEQIEAMRRLMNRRDATVVSLLGYAGLRPGEVPGLRWGDINGDLRGRCRGGMNLSTPWMEAWTPPTVGSARGRPLDHGPVPYEMFTRGGASIFRVPDRLVLVIRSGGSVRQA
jgi:integrase